MNKSVLIAIQPYYVFLIIARAMGWNIPQDKTVEVRKDFPKDSAWNKRVHIYCSKNRRSFNRIPKQYQPLMEKFLGKVVGEFVCAKIEMYDYFIKKPLDELIDGEYRHYLTCNELERTCLRAKELEKYLNEEDGYGWHISDLKIYDKPKELGEFKTPNKAIIARTFNLEYGKPLSRPPQSWCYVEEPKA